MLMAFICAVRALTIALAFRRDDAAEVSVAALTARLVMETLTLMLLMNTRHTSGQRGDIPVDVAE